MSSAAPVVQRHTHVSGLTEVAAALDDLHRDVLRTSGAETSHVRLSVLNFVAACSDSALVEGAVETVVQVAAHHPARAIVIHGDASGDMIIESDVSLRTSEKGDDYIELVRLEVHGEAAYHLSSVVQPLLIPDIPVQLWLVGAPPLEQAFRVDAVSLSERIILDSGAYPDPVQTLSKAAAELAAYGLRLHIADLTWERLHPWREAIAQAFDGPAMRPWLDHVRGVDIVSTGAWPSVEAWLLGGWLSASLGWPDAGGPALDVAAVPSPDQPAPELRRVRVRCRDQRHTARVEVVRRAGALATSIDVDAGVVASRATKLPRWTDALTISRLMAETSDDAVYRRAVQRAAAIAAANA